MALRSQGAGRKDAEHWKFNVAAVLTGTSRERIDASISMTDHLTKDPTRALFHRHADYLLGHVPPAHSPTYQSAIGTYTDSFHTSEMYVPESFTTPLCATAAWVHAPLPSDYAGNPWLIVLLHG